MSLQDMSDILDHFPNQPLDFYGAMRASIYDNQIRKWIETEVIDESLTNQEANLTELCRRLLDKWVICLLVLLSCILAVAVLYLKLLPWQIPCFWLKNVYQPGRCYLVTGSVWRDIGRCCERPRVSVPDERELKCLSTGCRATGQICPQAWRQELWGSSWTDFFKGMKTGMLR